MHFPVRFRNHLKKFSHAAAGLVSSLKMIWELFFQFEFCKNGWVVTSELKNPPVRGQWVSFCGFENVGNVLTYLAAGPAFSLKIFQKLFHELEVRMSWVRTYRISESFCQRARNSSLCCWKYWEDFHIQLPIRPSSSQYLKKYLFNFILVVENNLIVTCRLNWWTLILRAIKFLLCVEGHQKNFHVQLQTRTLSSRFSKWWIFSLNYYTWPWKLFFFLFRGYKN